VERRGDHSVSRASRDGGQARARADGTPYFFVSAAPGEDDIYVTRFYDDLTDAVRSRLAPRSAADIGYLDRGDVDPPYWPTDAKTALASTRTFVALCSSRYFMSARCGRSWTVFADRIRGNAARTGADQSGLIAVPWADAGLGALPSDEATVGIEQTPHGEDLRVLIRLSRFRRDYQRYVDSLARRIVDIANAGDLPAAAPRVSLDNVRDAFADHPLRRGEHEPVHVAFAVVAGTREQMRPVRANLDSYGDHREDWTPYLPSSPQPVVDRAAAVAATRRIGSEVVSPDALAERIAAARRRNEIVVLLVDAWATQLGELRAVIERANAGARDATAVLVPTNYADPETDEHRGLLRVAVLAAFPDRGRRPDLTFHPEVDTVERFDADLAVAIMEAQGRLIRSAAAAAPPSTVRPSARPILGGP
jgi:FxsC-like protein